RGAHPATGARARAFWHYRQCDSGGRHGYSGAAEDPRQRKIGSDGDRPQSAPPADDAARRRILYLGAVLRKDVLDDRQHATGRRRGGVRRMSLPGLGQLESTPEILRLLMGGLSEEDANWKPGPKRFSIAETLEHLSHVEGHCFRARV